MSQRGVLALRFVGGELLGELLLPRGGFLRRQRLLPGQVLRPLHRRGGREVPDALQVRVTVGRPERRVLARGAGGQKGDEGDRLTEVSQPGGARSRRAPPIPLGHRSIVKCARLSGPLAFCSRPGRVVRHHAAWARSMPAAMGFSAYTRGPPGVAGPPRGRQRAPPGEPPAARRGSTEEPQNPDGQRRGRDDRADHPADEPGFEILDLGPDLGEAGLELVGGDVVAVFEAVADGLGDDLGLVAVDAASGQLPGDRERVEHSRVA